MSILITGGTKGIGRAIALAFAEPSVDVFLNYAGDDEAAREAHSLVEATGARCHVIKQDVGTPEGARAVLAAVAERTDTLDQLVHCAVRAIPKPALDCDAHDFTAAVNLNGTALLYLVQAADPLLVRGSTVFLPHQPGRAHRGAQLRRHRRRQGAGGIFGAISRKRTCTARHPHQQRGAGRGGHGRRTSVVR